MNKIISAQATVSLLILPYSSQNGRSTVEVLVAELKSSRWTRFSAAVAFAKQSGTYPMFVDAIASFAKSGRVVELTLGANTFGSESAGSDYEAIETLVTKLEGVASARLFLYREKTRTFHPKIYLFDNEKTRRALIILGSSNWTDGSLTNNVEANLIVELDLRKKDQRRLHAELRGYFSKYWQASE